VPLRCLLGRESGGSKNGRFALPLLLGWSSRSWRLEHLEDLVFPADFGHRLGILRGALDAISVSALRASAPTASGQPRLGNCQRPIGERTKASPGGRTISRRENEETADRYRGCVRMLVGAVGRTVALQKECELMLTRPETEFASISDGVDDRGSSADIESVVLRDGSSVVMRPLAAGDEAAIASWFAGLAAETRYARFFAFLKQLDPRTQSELARVDHFDHEAISAVASDGSTVGIARYIRIGKSRSAEVAVAVADDWRGRGIAGMLLERVATRAEAVGIEQFIAICLATNHRVIRLLSRLGPTAVGPSDAGLVELRIDLTSAPPDRAAPGPASGGRRD